MNFKHPFFRVLAIYLVVALATLTPLASLHRAAMAIGLKTLLVGGLVGGAALLALGALAGPASAIGAAGCAGTSFMGVLGGAVGTAVAGITGLCVATGTLAAGTLGTMGLMVGGALLGVLGLMASPWMIVPAVVLGGGLLVWAWSKYRYGSPYDQTRDRPFGSSIFDAGGRLANQSESGYSDGGAGSSGSFLDRFRSIFDRDRRDDSFFYNSRSVDSQGYLRRGNDIFSRIDQFFNGRNRGTAAQNALYGTYGAYGVMDPNGVVPTDRSGRVVGQGSAVGRTGLVPLSPSETPALSEGETPSSSDELSDAEAARKAAYERLIRAIKDQKQNEAPAAAGTSSLQSDEVQEAIRDYREADRHVKEITGRLQDREKQ